MDEDIGVYALNLAERLDIQYADVRLESQERNDIVLKNGVFDLVSHIVNQGIGVRVMTNYGIGFSSCNLLDKKSVEKTVKEAYRQSRACKRKIPPRLSEENPVEAEWSVPEKIKLCDTGIEEKLDTLFSWEKVVSSLGGVTSRVIMFADKQTDKVFLNTEGSRVRGYLPTVVCFYFVTVRHNHEIEQAARRFGYAGGWEAFEGFQITEDAEREIRMLKELIEKGKKSPQGKMDLVAGPDVVGIICHESCGHPTEADRILGREASQAGASFMNTELLGTKIGSPSVTVVDDPTLEHSFGYYAYDDEGVKARRRYLYKEGIITEFLHNRESAAAMQTLSNAAARSTSYNREPIVRMGNTFLLPGDYEFEELFEDIKFGIYMKSFNEWNIDDKRYNQKYIGRESYLIENGEIKTMVKRPVLEVTTPAFWSSVDACGKNLMFRAGNCGKGDPIQEMEVLYGGPPTRLRNIQMR